MISRHADEQIASARTRIDASRDAARIVELEAQLADARRRIERATLTIRVLELTRTDARQKLARLTEENRDLWRTLLVRTRQWQWVSRIVRAYVTPAQVQEFRDSEQ